ncbi:MAG TPA: phenylalanine--tRNA ligase subunit beta [Allosphingosinicella sp.]|nr:phenylalanine--tRNA ligase subunit beta [Allosphingosinicella sp.]
MKFTFAWLKEHLETEASLDEVVERLTAVGLEVEGVENPAEKLKPFVIAEVLAAVPHPQADKLRVLTVDSGTGEPVQVVCGAANARTGLKGVFGAPGAYVPGSDLTLKVAAIRGVESRGMMCSIRELQLGDEHAGIIELPADAPVGAPYAHWAGLDDPVIDIAVTPNRPDCLGVNGIARDLAAAGLGLATHRVTHDKAAEGGFPSPVPIQVEQGSGCAVFAARAFRGVRNGPSPDWLQRRLLAVGLRPISALVDITNFFSLDRARPLHVYDVARVEGTIRARRGEAGERFVALNGKEYEATPDDCVIADDARVLGFGGVMGGEYSGVTGETTDVLLECAWFDPEMTGATGRRHGILSDARARFERGVDPASVVSGIEAATRMILEHCGGEASELVIAGEIPSHSRTIAFRPARVEALGGIDVPATEQERILLALGFEAEHSEPERWQIRPPSWRPDVDGEADLVEEVLRISGYDAITSTPLPRAPGVARPTATAEQLVERKARRAAAGRGLNEAVTWSFISEPEAEAFGGSAWVLTNPISEEMKVMRPSLLPGLLAAANRNMARGAESIRLFEVGRRYLGDQEHPTLALVLAGERGPRHWRSGKAGGFDAFDAKAEALAILAAVGAPADNLQIMGDAAGSYHPGRSGRLTLGPKNVLAEFGALHPRLLKTFDLDGPVAVAEIYLDSLPRKRSAGSMRGAYAPPPLQAVKRDFAFLVPKALAADSLLRAVRGADKASIAGAALFDVFTGQGVPDGEKSLAVEVTLQPAEKSFAEAELKAISDKIVASAAKLGARLRD